MRNFISHFTIFDFDLRLKFWADNLSKSSIRSPSDVILEFEKQENKEIEFLMFSSYGTDTHFVHHQDVFNLWM